MRRPGGAATVALLEKLRSRIPDLALRTTFICGFPGETDEEHAELTRVVKSMGFERGGAFAYSQEEGTPAAEMDDHLDDDTKEARRDELVSIFQDRAEEWAQAQVRPAEGARANKHAGGPRTCTTCPTLLTPPNLVNTCAPALLTPPPLGDTCQVGKRMEVVIDTMEGLDAIGRSYADAPDIDGSVRLPQCVLAPGTVVTVEVVAADVMELVAQPVYDDL